MATQSTNTEATAPTGDIKIFIDAFNKDFDNLIKKLTDSQNNVKNIWNDAIAISTPRTSTWPKDESVKTIGDLFKYVFPDPTTSTINLPPDPITIVGGTTPITDNKKLEDEKSFNSDLKLSKDQKIKDFYKAIGSGVFSNKVTNIYKDLKKPGITNPNLWSPGQYYFDVFMSFVISSNGPVLNENGAYYRNVTEMGLTSSLSILSKSGDDVYQTVGTSSVLVNPGYQTFAAYICDLVKDKVDYNTDIKIDFDDDTQNDDRFPSIKVKYRSGSYTELMKDPTFDETRGEAIGSGNTIDFNGNYEHILLYKAVIQAGDNYKTVVLPVENIQDTPTTPPTTTLAKVESPTAVGVVQFKFNVEKTDTFIVVGGTVSPAPEFTIVPNDGTEYIMDVFTDTDELGDEYKEDIFAGDDELKSTYESYIYQIEQQSGQNLSPEEKTEIAKEMVKYKPGKPSKSPPADVIKAMKDYGITNALEQAHFLAQCAHESGQFAWKREFASGKAYEGRKDLGNTQTGDGVRYKGRGYIQITGRSNYTSYNSYLKSKGINDDVVAHPELLEGKFAADCSVWFWSVSGPKVNKNFPKRSRQGSSVADVTQISKWVNGGTNGLNDRIEKFGYYWSVLEKNGTAYS